MTFVKLSGEKITKTKLEKGVHYVEVALNEVQLFIKEGKKIPLCKPAMRTSLLDTEDLEFI
jgi:alpha-glucosidase